MDISTIKKKITNIGSSINSIDKSILDDADKIKDSIVKEMDVIQSKVVTQTEKIFHQIAKITEMIFDYGYKLVKEIFNDFFELFMVGGCSSVCCTMMPFILLFFILSTIFKIAGKTSKHNDTNDTNNTNDNVTMQDLNTYNLSNSVSTSTQNNINS